MDGWMDSYGMPAMHSCLSLSLSLSLSPTPFSLSIHIPPFSQSTDLPAQIKPDSPSTPPSTDRGSRMRGHYGCSGGVVVRERG
mmetsp:Transcript_20313/g.49354  ORF Transcript_20313/g.49354 Transcript_20313/m.49354 type:complete len:83 (-) Transcript_20313:855-1103(-)